MLFLSQHVHVDNEEYFHVDNEKYWYPSDSLLTLENNSNGVTLETKTLDLDTMQLTPSNNLIYSYQASNLIDQMIILEALKKTKPSIEAIFKSFELHHKHGISLAIAQVMLTAVENEKGYLIPNLLRLNSQGRNYLETNYLAENEGVDLMLQMININREDVARLLINKTPKDKLEEALTQVDDLGRNAVILALDNNNTELVKLIMDKIPKNKLGEALTQVDYFGRNALMLALDNNNTELVKLIMDEIPKNKLGEVLTQVDNDGRNALTLALNNNNKELAELIKERHRAIVPQLSP
jgi:ankyrin repeat protein